MGKPSTSLLPELTAEWAPWCSNRLNFTSIQYNNFGTQSLVARGIPAYLDVFMCAGTEEISVKINKEAQGLKLTIQS